MSPSQLTVINGEVHKSRGQARVLALVGCQGTTVESCSICDVASLRVQEAYTIR